MFAGTFQYESKQPIQTSPVSSTKIAETNEQNNIHVPPMDNPFETNNNIVESENDAELILGTELFHSQIELNHQRSSLRKVKTKSTLTNNFFCFLF